MSRGSQSRSRYSLLASFRQRKRGRREEENRKGKKHDFIDRNEAKIWTERIDRQIKRKREGFPSSSAFARGLQLTIPRTETDCENRQYRLLWIYWLSIVPHLAVSISLLLETIAFFPPPPSPFKRKEINKHPRRLLYTAIDRRGVNCSDSARFHYASIMQSSVSWARRAASSPTRFLSPSIASKIQ